MKRVCLLFIFLFAVGFAAGQNYFDIGGGTMPLDPKKKCTYLSAGKRFRSDRSGVDLSVSHRITSSCDNYFSGRMLMTQNISNNFYLGMGPGVGSLTEYKRGKFDSAQAATMEGLIGYRLPHRGAHLQCGITQPTHIFHNGTGHKLSKKPALSFSLNMTY